MIEYTINFCIVANGVDVYFRSKNNLVFRRVATAFCERQGINYDTVAFQFNDTFIDPDMTVEQIGIRENARIVALL